MGDSLNWNAVPELGVVLAVDGNLVLVMFDKHQELEVLARDEREWVTVRFFGSPLLGLDRVADDARWRREDGTQMKCDVVAGVHVWPALQVDGKASCRVMRCPLDANEGADREHTPRNGSNVREGFRLLTSLLAGEPLCVAVVSGCFV